MLGGWWEEEDCELQLNANKQIEGAKNANVVARKRETWRRAREELEMGMKWAPPGEFLFRAAFEEASLSRNSLGADGYPVAAAGSGQLVMVCWWWEAAGEFPAKQRARGMGGWVSM